MNIQVQEAQHHMFLFCSRLFLTDYYSCAQRYFTVYFYQDITGEVNMILIQMIVLQIPQTMENISCITWLPQDMNLIIRLV